MLNLILPSGRSRPWVLASVIACVCIGTVHTTVAAQCDTQGKITTTAPPDVVGEVGGVQEFRSSKGLQVLPLPGSECAQ